MRSAALVILCLTAVAAVADDQPIIAMVKSKLKDSAKPFTLMVTAKLKVGATEKFASAFKPCAAATRKESGCGGYELHTDPDKSDVVVLIERWKSVAALEAHLNQPYTQALFKAIPEWSVGAPEIKVLLPVE
jgi:quinol monooxygenase YgiN